MKIKKSTLRKIVKEEFSKALSEGEYDIETGVPAMSPEELKGEKLNDILSRLADPEQRRRAEHALNESGVFDLDPIEHKKAIKFIMNAHRQHADGVLDFILVKIADEVLKVKV